MKQIAIIIIVLAFILTTVTIQSKENRKEIFESIFILSGVITITVAVLVVFNALWKKLKGKKLCKSSTIPYPPIIYTTSINSGSNSINENNLPNYNNAIFNVPLPQMINSERPLYPPKYETIVEAPPPTTIGAPPSYRRF